MTTFWSALYKPMYMHFCFFLDRITPTDLHWPMAIDKQTLTNAQINDSTHSDAYILRQTLSGIHSHRHRKRQAHTTVAHAQYTPCGLNCGKLVKIKIFPQYLDFLWYQVWSKPVWNNPPCFLIFNTWQRCFIWGFILYVSVIFPFVRKWIVHIFI